MFYVGSASFLRIKAVKTIPDPIIIIPLELISRLKFASSWIECLSREKKHSKIRIVSINMLIAMWTILAASRTKTLPEIPKSPMLTTSPLIY